MGDTFIGEIRPFAGTYAPRGWIVCDGRKLAIRDFQVLFAIIGLQFGGNIQQGYFNIPDMRGRVAVGVGQGSGLSRWNVNYMAGTEAVTLTLSQIPVHKHTVSTNFGGYKTYAANFTDKPAANFSYVSRYLVPTSATTANTYNAYGPAGSQADATTMSPDMLAPAGTYGPHENRQPVLALQFAINASDGSYPEFN